MQTRIITAGLVGQADIQWLRDGNGSPSSTIMRVNAEELPPATGWAVPIRSDGEVAERAWSYSDTLRRAIAGHKRSLVPNIWAKRRLSAAHTFGGRGMDQMDG